MDRIDLDLLRISQDGLPLVARPYHTLGLKLNISEEEVIARFVALEREGIVRRFAATIGHRALGILANAMVIWNVPQDDVERVGELFGRMEEVTHCYERARAKDWPYNLYTMVHSRSKDDCIRLASRLSEMSKIDDYRILFSEKEYKKTSARI